MASTLAARMGRAQEPPGFCEQALKQGGGSQST